MTVNIPDKMKAKYLKIFILLQIFTKTYEQGIEQELDAPIFDKSNYFFIIKPNYIGLLHKFNSNLNSRLNYLTEYSMEIPNDYLQSRLKLDSSKGNLSIIKPIQFGFYELTLFAKNNGNKDREKAVVQFEVDFNGYCICGDMNISNHRLLNNEQYQQKSNKRLDDKRNLIAMKTKISDSKISEFASNYNKELPNTSRVSKINIYSPEFIYPPNSDFCIGYPDNKISILILPPHLMKVTAIDKDSGLNSQISYSIKGSTDFGVDKTTGIIFPYAKALKNLDSTTFFIEATNRNGGPDRRKTSLKVIVKKLHSKHLALITFKLKEYQNVSQVLNKINYKIDLNLMPLEYGIVPSPEYDDVVMTTKRVNFKSTLLQTQLKVWVYCFDNNMEPILGSTIIRKLKALPGVSWISTELYNDVMLPEQQNITGFIIAVVILSIICVGLFGFLAWMFYFRKLIFGPVIDDNKPVIGNTKTNSESSATVNKKPSVIKEKDPAPPYSYVIIDPKYLESINFGNQIKDRQQTYAKRKQSIVKSINNQGPARNKRAKAGVTFNDSVQKIEIEARNQLNSTALTKN